MREREKTNKQKQKHQKYKAKGTISSVPSMRWYIHLDVFNNSKTCL